VAEDSVPVTSMKVSKDGFGLSRVLDQMSTGSVTQSDGRKNKTYSPLDADHPAPA
jgi:hypothetical protein